MTMRAGEVYDTRCTERLVVRVGTAESNGERLLADLYVRPTGGRVPPHVHQSMEEAFTVVQGEVGTWVAGVQKVLTPGENVRIAPGTPHSWWSVGVEEARVLLDVRPAGRFEEMWRQFMGLQQDGKTDSRGTPPFLQIVALSRAFPDVMEIAGVPHIVQRALFAVLAPVARARGYKGCNDEYLRRAPSATVDLEPLPWPLAASAVRE